MMIPSPLLTINDKSSDAEFPATECSVPVAELFVFSICTVVNDGPDYRAMLDTFQAAGFDTQSCEYLYIDNRAGNQFDAYSALRQMISRAQGRFLILCHQDIRMIYDSRADLEQRLEELDALDPAWTLAGNAGGTEHHQRVVRISDPSGENQHIGNFPTKVRSLDENFIVMKRSSAISPSYDLSGFHLYGTDLCLQARSAGLTAYVIDFHLKHLSIGIITPDYFHALERLERKAYRLMQPLRIKTTCLTAFLTGNPVKNWLLRRRRARQMRVSK